MSQDEHRPALDVELPDGDPILAELIAATCDDFHPFAVEDNPDPKPVAGRARQRFHFSSPVDRRRAAAALRRHYASAGVFVSPVDVRDDGAWWAERTQAALKSVRVGHLVVAPPWDIPAPDPDTVSVVIRPSMGFGTGHHASTRLCLQALQDIPLHGRTVLDLGTGSGVLAIAAAKLHAAHVVGLDNDQDALACATDNVRLNGVDAVVEIVEDDLATADTDPSREATVRSRLADVVLANLTGALLCRMAASICDRAMPGAMVVVSGLTSDEEGAVRAAMAPWARFHAASAEGEWTCLVFQLWQPDERFRPSSHKR